MVEFEERIVINRPAEKVFAFISDLENDPPWTSAAEVRRTSNGPIGIGTTFRQRARFLGRRFEFSFDVVGYEAAHSITVQATSGVFSLVGARTVDPINDHASQVTASGGGHARGVLRLVERPLAAVGAHQLRTQLERLKQLLEGSAS